MRDSFASSWFLGGCLLWVLFAFGYDMPVGALSARRARVLAAPAGPVDGRAATACLCGAESPPLSLWGLVSASRLSRGRGSDAVVFLRSLARSACVRNVVVCIRTHRHGGYYYYVIAPGSGRGRARPQLAPPSSQCESCAFPSCSRDLPLSRSARAPPRPSRSTSRTVVSLNRGSRAFGL